MLVGIRFSAIIDKRVQTHHRVCRRTIYKRGLGKTVTALALIVANPAPLHRKVLPLELHALEEKARVNCPRYDNFPFVVRTKQRSDGTLIFAPDGLLRWVGTMIISSKSEAFTEAHRIALLLVNGNWRLNATPRFCRSGYCSTGKTRLYE